MTAASARTAANLVVAMAGLAAACVILTTPSLRRVASRSVRVWLGRSVPWLMNEVRQAWMASGRAA